MSVGYNRTNADISLQAGLHYRRTVTAGRLPVMIRAIDGLLNEVEDLNLRDIRQVPGPLRERVTQLLAGTVGELPEPLPSRWRTSYAMDLLFDAQRKLTRQRSLDLGFQPASDEAPELEPD